MRALGNLARFVRHTSSSCVHDKPVANTGFSSTCNNVTMLPTTSNVKAFDGGAINSSYPASLKDLDWLERMVQAFISCVTTGNVKVLSCIVVFLENVKFNLVQALNLFLMLI